VGKTSGTLVGMAYVVARRNGRFEIRESLHTPKGSRARGLAGFETLDDQVLAKAASRAQTRFDVQAVLASARRAGAPLVPASAEQGAVAGLESHDSPARFVQASRRMAQTLERTTRARARRKRDPGAALIDLLSFADAVTSSQPVRSPEALGFPVLARLVKDRPSGVANRR
jgi:hypothetical protein